MEKKKRSWKLPTAFFGLFFFGIIMCYSGIHFPFINAKFMLNLRLNRDFGVKLPKSAVITHSYWVAYRDPEHVFKIEIAPTEIKPFIEAIQTTTTTHYIAPPTDSKLQSVHPLYGIPTWWNNPPLPDALSLSITINNKEGNPKATYNFLYSPSTGTTYLVWCEY